MDRPLALLAVVALAALAGCAVAAPATDSGPGAETAPSSTDRTAVQVENGTLPIEATEPFHRVRNLTDQLDVGPPTVGVRNFTEAKEFDPTWNTRQVALGFRNVSLRPDDPGGVTFGGTGNVYLHPGAGDPVRVEQVLVHEYVHTIQFRSGMVPALAGAGQGRLTAESESVQTMLVEGGAVYVTDAYSKRFLQDAQSQSDRLRSLHDDGVPSERLFYGQYVHGADYVEGVVDDPADLAAVYEDSPNTTEQILHGFSPDEEPRAALDVEAGSTERWRPLANDTYGEFYLRTALENELDSDVAREAAAGWGQDVITVYGEGDHRVATGWVWTMRMDDASEADELAAAMETYAERRDEDSERAFAASRPDERTVALVFGEPAFVDDVSVSSNGSPVTIDVEG